MNNLDVSKGIEENLNKLKQIKVEELKVPEFYIAGWPKKVGEVSVKLRKFGFYRRILGNGKFFFFRRWFCLGIFRIKFGILADGTITARTLELVDCYSRKNSDNKPTDEKKANALLMFSQFKDRALPKIVRQVVEDARLNQEVVDEVKRALEPFMPQIVADELAK